MREFTHSSRTLPPIGSCVYENFPRVFTNMSPIPLGVTSRCPTSSPRLVPAFTITVTLQSASLDWLPGEVEIIVNLRIKAILSKLFARTTINWIGTYEDPDPVQATGEGLGVGRERSGETHREDQIPPAGAQLPVKAAGASG